MLLRFTISQRLPSLFLVRVLLFLVTLSFLGPPPESLRAAARAADESEDCARGIREGTGRALQLCGS
jgi:hypothetical protein